MKPLTVAVRCVASVLLFSCVPAAHALSRDISAEFRPDPSRPGENTFRNTTPVSGYCELYPGQCGTTMFSIRLPLGFNSTGPIEANHGNVRHGAMFKVPVAWRTVQVTHTGTGETEDVEIRVTAIGSEYRLPAPVVELVGGGVTTQRAHTMLWGYSWVTAPSPCTFGGNGAYNTTWYGFYWKAPVEGICAKRARYPIPNLRYRYLDFAYELRTPNPLKMSSGQYTGTFTYTVGPGRDFDMGDVMIPDDSALTLNFKLDVEHTLKVDVPPGGNLVNLEPQEGWQSWLSSGRKPTRLFRDQRFHISASSRFKMALECQHVFGNTCAVFQPGTGHVVPVDVSVSLPDGLTDGSGQPVNRRRLYRDGSGTGLFQPSLYVDRRPGTLHFEIGREQVEQMLDSGAKAYTGNVTVVWNSEI